MRFSFQQKDIVHAPKGYVRVRIIEDEKGPTQRLKEGGVEWLLIGGGKKTEMTLRKFRILCRRIIRAAKAHKIKKIAVANNLAVAGLFATQEKMAEVVAESFEVANFEWNAFKTKPKEGWGEVEEVLICGETSKDMRAGFTHGQEIGRAVNACRVLANTPGGDMTPRTLAKAAKMAVKGLPVKVTTLGRKEMERLGMGALLGVAKGSSEEPTFTIMEYVGFPKPYMKSAPQRKPIVLVGKGITFDSGGLNLKPTNAIYEMHMDMSGAAAVIHAVALAARLKLKTNVVGLIPAAENMPGNSAYRPGDVLRSLSGKTIEVLNTDAEGRLILADALTYAKRFNPSAVVDVATLTGAAVVALGLHASALMTRDEKLAKTIEEAGEASGDYAWRLPLWDEYEEAVRGTFADITNSATGPYARTGGAIEGGMFLWQFAKDLKVPWAHLDIAPRMTAAPSEELGKGAAGAPVRLLVRFIEEWKP